MYFDTLRRPDAEIEYKFSFPQRASKFWSNSLLLGTHVSKYTRSSLLEFASKFAC